jgi:hypothetical protein
LNKWKQCTRRKQQKLADRVAASLQHYGHLLPKHTAESMGNAPATMVVDPIPKTDLFRTAILSSSCALVAGTVAQVDDQVYVLQGFFQQNGTVQAQLVLLRARSSFPPEVVKYMDNADFVATDQTMTRPVGHLQQLETPASLSCWEVRGGALVRKASQIPREQRKEWIEGMVLAFLACRTAFLEQDALLRLASDHIGLSASMLAWTCRMVQKNFGCLATEFEGLSGNPGAATQDGTCTPCQRHRMLVVNKRSIAGRKTSLCEDCYVRSRRVYRAFSPMQTLRVQFHKQKEWDQALVDERLSVFVSGVATWLDAW